MSSSVHLVPENSVDEFECTQLIVFYLRIAGCVNTSLLYRIRHYNLWQVCKGLGNSAHH